MTDMRKKLVEVIAPWIEDHDRDVAGNLADEIIKLIHEREADAAFDARCDAERLD